MAAIDTSFKVTNVTKVQKQEGVDIVSLTISLIPSDNLSVIVIKEDMNVIRMSTEQKGNIIEFRAEVSDLI
jgi:riboflavin synthase alpha subunit